MAYSDMNKYTSNESVASDASSRIIQEHRARKARQEESIRNRISQIASPDTTDSSSLSLYTPSKSKENFESHRSSIVSPDTTDKSVASVRSDASSRILREHRVKHLEQERLIRDRMNRISSPDSTTTASKSKGGRSQGSLRRIASPDSTESSYLYQYKSDDYSVASASEISSRVLREAQERHPEQTKRIKSRMNQITSPDNTSSGSTRSSSLYRAKSERHRRKKLTSPDYSSHSTYDLSRSNHSTISLDGSVESSLLSLNASRTSGKSKELKHLTWQKVPVEFSFGILTAWNEAPSVGQYRAKNSSNQSHRGDNSTISSKSSSRLIQRCSILNHIMKKIKEVSKVAVQDRTGNVIIKARTPYIVSVQRDKSYKPQKGREGVVRSFIKAVVPIEISDVHFQQLTRSSEIISRIIIRQALIEGVKRKVFEPLKEDY